MVWSKKFPPHKLPVFLMVNYPFSVNFSYGKWIWILGDVSFGADKYGQISHKQNDQLYETGESFGLWKTDEAPDCQRIQQKWRAWGDGHCWCNWFTICLFDFLLYWTIVWIFADVYPCHIWLKIQCSNKNFFIITREPQCVNISTSSQLA